MIFYSYKSDNSLFVKLVTVEKHKHKTFPFRNPQIFAINILVHVLDNVKLEILSS